MTEDEIKKFQVGVVFEFFLSKKKYVVDSFTFEYNRLINTINITSKEYKDNMKGRQTALLRQLSEHILENHTEKHRARIINFLAANEGVKTELKKYPNESLGIVFTKKVDKVDIIVLRWPAFEKMLKELPEEYFEYGEDK